MPREKPEKKAAKLQHEPLQRQIEHKNGKLKEPKIKVNRNQTGEPNEEEDADDEEPASKGTLKSASRVAKDADTSTFEDWGDDEENDDDEDVGGKRLNQGDSDEEDDDDEGDEEYEGEEEEFVELDGENFAAAGVTDSEVTNECLFVYNTFIVYICIYT